MKIYLVTIEDQATIDDLDAAMDEEMTIYIGDADCRGPVAEIKEYVNVDSP